jgi:predicted acyltransferase
MHHAAWNGLTATDLVFPTFLFVVGVSIVFACEAWLAKGDTRAQLAGHTAKRAATLFLLGVVVNGFPFFELEHLRIYGVLQRIAICYLVVGLFYLWDRRVWTKIAALAVVLLGYWVLMQWVPVPGVGVPGRDVAFLDKDMNMVAWLDRQLLPGHLYEDWTTHNLRDPEGLLSDLPALGTALLGLLTGLWLRSERTLKRRAAGLIAGSAACLATGYLWSVWFPLNKKLWTSSYVLVAAGWALAVFALTFWLIDVKGWGREGAEGKGWTRWLVRPCLIFGSNAIAAYMISEVPGVVLGEIHWAENGRDINTYTWYFEHVIGWIANPGLHAFAFSLSFVTLCFLPVWWMYSKKIFWKV